MIKLERINKDIAQSKLNKGCKNVYAIASNLSPNYKDNCFLRYVSPSVKLNDLWLDNFKYRYCNEESGYGILFYTKE